MLPGLSRQGGVGGGRTRTISRGFPNALSSQGAVSFRKEEAPGRDHSRRVLGLDRIGGGEGTGWRDGGEVAKGGHRFGRGICPGLKED